LGGQGVSGLGESGETMKKGGREKLFGMKKRDGFLGLKKRGITSGGCGETHRAHSNLLKK